MNNKIILKEIVSYIELSPQIIKESISRNDGKFVIENMLLQQKDSKNQNNRKYPGSILEREVNKYIKEKINTKQAFGELDHPDNSFVELKHASHLINGVRWDGDNLYGDVQILSTPMGEIVKNILMDGCRIGISSRALGSVETIKEMNEETGETDTFDQVQDDMDLIAWDCVSDPSVRSATYSLHENYNKNKKEIIIENIDYYVRKINCWEHENCGKCLKENTSCKLKNNI